MQNPLLELAPNLLWKHFHNITTIPHPSKKEQAIVTHVLEFGKSLGLDSFIDKAGNVIIRKPATVGFENHRGVILQSHLDMVPQKNNDTVHDFDKDPIRTYVDNGWVKAVGTTLGADNGIGVAAIMAVLESDDILHGPLEALFTIDEETGMTGAFNLQSNVLKGDVLLNLDSEEEGELYVGCAGGTTANMVFSFPEKTVPENCVAYTIHIKGLNGGHSGLDINLGRGNANKILFRFLKDIVANYGVRLSSVTGGSLSNAIPREASAVVVIPCIKVSEFLESAKEFESILINEIGNVEPALKLLANESDLPEFIMDEVVQDDLINAIVACPNGVVRMSTEMINLVETSLNLAVVKTENSEVKIKALLRSSVDSAKDDLESSLESLFRLAGAEIWFDGHYPGWKPNMDSSILKTMTTVYEQKWGVTPQIKAIHAGLECGILGATYPNWDMISFGPTICFPHSPDEKVNIASVGKFYDYLVLTLKAI